MSLAAALAVAAGVPWLRPFWFAHDYQLLSEAREPLGVHLQQLAAASLLVALSLEAAPRTPSPVSTLGAGTFSCFVLHWWLRPIWLAALVATLKRLAPFLGTEGIFASAIAFVYCGALVAVQWSLSGVSVALGPPLLRSVRGLAGLAVGWALLAAAVSRHVTSSPYLTRCAAFVPHQPLTAPNDHWLAPNDHWLRARDEMASPAGLSLCVVSDREPFAVGTCDRLSKRGLRDPSDLRDALPCLNRAHACAHGYSYLSPSMPWLNLLRGPPPPDASRKTDALATACSDQGAVLHEVYHISEVYYIRARRNSRVPYVSGEVLFNN
jgi:hypothetical protein